MPNGMSSVRANCFPVIAHDGIRRSSCTLHYLGPHTLHFDGQHPRHILSLSNAADQHPREEQCCGADLARDAHARPHQPDDLIGSGDGPRFGT